MQEQLPRMRAGFVVVCPHPGPLPQGEGEKRYALFSGRVSKCSPINKPGCTLLRI